MKHDFLCPYCKGKLNVGGYIIFSAKTHDGKAGLILLSHKVGDYKTVRHPSFKIKKGELTDFRCPICHADLAALEFNRNLVKLLMTDDNRTVYEVVFSGIEGEHCTYVLHDKELEAFGENSQKYINYVEDGPRF